MTGRPAKPTNIHRLQGTFEKSRHTNRMDVDVKPLIYVPLPPNRLSSEGREMWMNLAPLLVSHGLLSEFDLPAFETLVETTGESRRLRAAQNGGEPVRTADISDCERRQLALLIQFGLTPAARAKIKIEKVKQDESPLAKFIS